MAYLLTCALKITQFCRYIYTSSMEHMAKPKTSQQQPIHSWNLQAVLQMFQNLATFQGQTKGAVDGEFPHGTAVVNL